LLGSSETSARRGAIYTLHELALEEEKYRQQIVQILCSHIRSKTPMIAIRPLPIEVKVICSSILM
jgi:hypothetical protein